MGFDIVSGERSTEQTGYQGMYSVFAVRHDVVNITLLPSSTPPLSAGNAVAVGATPHPFSQALPLELAVLSDGVPCSRNVP